MTDGKKIILYCVAVIVIFSAGFLTRHFIGKANDNKRIAEHRQIVAELRNQLAEQTERIDELTEGNEQLTSEAEKLRDEIAAISQQLDNAEAAITKIKSGLSSDIGTVQGIREAIGKIVQAISELGETE